MIGSKILERPRAVPSLVVLVLANTIVRTPPIGGFSLELRVGTALLFALAKLLVWRLVALPYTHAKMKTVQNCSH
jgi:hypothetical protein